MWLPRERTNAIFLARAALVTEENVLSLSIDLLEGEKCLCKAAVSCREAFLVKGGEALPSTRGVRTGMALNPDMDTLHRPRGC